MTDATACWIEIDTVLTSEILYRGVLFEVLD
jgi:hypothetical protein